MRTSSLVRGSLIAVALFAAACSDGVAPLPEPLFSGGNNGVARSGRLLACKRLAYDSVTQTVGARGGVLRVSKHALSIPAGALSRPVKITLVAPRDTLRRIEARPEGLVFAQPVELTLSYASCDEYTEPKQIVYVNDSLQIIAYVPSVDDVSGKKVTGALRHFSSYALSW